MVDPSGMALKSRYSIYIQATMGIDVDGTHHLRRVSGREFNQQPSAIKRQVQEGLGPVVITDHGHPVAVLMSWSDYSRTQPIDAPLTELLAHPASADVDLPLERDSAPHSPVPL